MSLIDWSDPDEMLGLLVEYVCDESLAENRDATRAAFLQDLSTDLQHLTTVDFGALAEISDAIREIRSSQPREFLHDPVIAHVDACIEELERIATSQQPSRVVHDAASQTESGDAEGIRSRD